MLEDCETIGYLSLEDSPAGPGSYVPTTFNLGQRVRIGNLKDIEAIVTGIMIRSKGYVSYECSWINNGEKRAALFDEVEIGSSPEYRRAGFSVELDVETKQIRVLS